MHVHDYSLLDPIKTGEKWQEALQHIIMLMGCRMARAKFRCLVCGVLSPGKLLPSPKVTDPIPKTCAVWLMGSPM